MALVAIAALWLFELSPLRASVAILQASLPIAANLYVLAHRHGVHAGRISSAILVSTALAVVTVSAVLGWLHPGPRAARAGVRRPADPCTRVHGRLYGRGRPRGPPALPGPAATP